MLHGPDTNANTMQQLHRGRTVVPDGHLDGHMDGHMDGS